MSIFKPKVNGADKNLILSKGQQLKKATLKIGELERENEWLKQRLSYLLVSVNALGQHAKLEPLEAKAVIDAYIQKQELDMQKVSAEQAEVAKRKFAEDLRAGKAPEFKVIDRSEG